MDLTFEEFVDRYSDPDQKEKTIAEAKDKTLTITDENGEKFNVVPLKDATLSLAIFGDKLPNGFGFHDIRKFPIKDDDIVLCDFAKSGTHWLCNIMYFMLKDGPLDDVTSFQPPLLEMFNEAVVNQMPSPRILDTHQIPQLAPQDIFSNKGKVILLYRNPKDTVTSQFHHYRNMRLLEYKLSWECHLDNWVKGRIPYMEYCEYYTRWQKALEDNKDKMNFLLISYEELKKEPIDTMRKVSKHIGLDLSDERLAQIRDKCSLPNLKKDVESGAVKTPLITAEGKSVLYRKGIIGDWKNHFTVAQNERFDEIFKERLPENSIYKFQYT